MASYLAGASLSTVPADIFVGLAGEYKSHEYVLREDTHPHGA